MVLLEAQHLTKEEGGSLVVDGVDLKVVPGMRLGIAGETGSGKTTLLKMLAGLAQPASGLILFDGNKVPGPDEVLIPGHKSIAYLSQHFELRNNYRVHEVLEMASTVEPIVANQVYNDCKIDHLLHRWTDELSGGEKQRIALARLLTTSPSILLLDEPFSNLDTGHKNMLRIILNNITENEGVTMIMVSHDGADLLSWATDIAIMKSGKIIQEGTPRKLYENPKNEYCAGLLGKYTLLKAGEKGFENFRLGHGGNDDIIVRPEQFKIVTKDYDLVGTVHDVVFYGHYSTVLIKIENVILSMIAYENIPGIGSEVYIRFQPYNI